MKINNYSRLNGTEKKVVEIFKVVLNGIRAKWWIICPSGRATDPYQRGRIVTAMLGDQSGSEKLTAYQFKYHNRFRSIFF